MESILTSIKKLLGIDEDYECFDADIIMYINSTFNSLSQLGVTEADNFSISDDTTCWDDFIEDEKFLGMIKTYIRAKVKGMFDPPDRSNVLDALNKEIAESEWRIQVAFSTPREN